MTPETSPEAGVEGDAALASGDAVRYLSFVAFGAPVGQGQISFMGKGRAVHSNAARLLPWRDTLAGAAREAASRDEWPRTELALTVHATFYLDRPKAHYGVKGLKPSAPDFPAGRPDTDHLVRALGDALTAAGIWRDDSQVVTWRASKRYVTDHMQTPGAIVEVWPTKQ